MDDGKKMHPDNAEEWHHQSFADGQRAFVIFDELDKPVNGYDYTIRIRQIKEVLTKEIITLGEGEYTEEKIGDDKINTTYLWISQDRKYLTIEFQYYYRADEKEKHFLNLVIPSSSAAHPTDGKTDDYLRLEFRHNDENNKSNDDKQTDTLDNATYLLSEGYVSFKLNKIKEQMEAKKGLQIRVNTLYNGIQTYKVDFPK
ncbi:hypothetical protein EVA_04714 [gut metagenome]|uniref:NigD-like C-terminal beta sandwich domain-containing protein n=1 Tax=gut metagenome TaxID=749906 RepID=J9H1A7_9ZZZZ